ncbi:unnamed protein product [Cylindrotheca closterium]|uniref:Nucleotide-diphospho-sugar transferase domain-containing protein n=1 Tax=Cylindrotheca closterium TaxID=2856 RepID=A0AAD2G2U4_9STRA|nr:unnamed protein product [Cylindrotheca closterium]
MYNRLRHRTASADEEGGVLIGFNAIDIDNHNTHNTFHEYNHNNLAAASPPRIKSPYHRPNRHRTGSVNSVNSLKSHRIPYRSSRGYSFFVGFLVVVAILLVSGIGYSVFSIFHVALRGRPAWLYGQPLLMQHVAACLVEDDHDPPLPPRVLWEWHNYTTTTTKEQQRHEGGGQTRLLIAQYSGFGEYAQFLNWISPVHQEYARKHGYDYVILQGTLLDFPGIQQDCFSNLRATFNKIPILEMSYTVRHKYDYVLVLDTDAMIVTTNHHENDNHHNRWSELLPSNQLLAAQRVMRYDSSNAWDINAGVTLWNLHHPDFYSLVQRWKSMSQFGSMEPDPPKDKLRVHLENILTKNDDQYFLQTALLDAYSWWNRPVVAVIDEFNYYRGTLVKHFKRDKRSWSTTGLEQRLERVKEAIREVCISQRKGIAYCLSQQSKSEIDYSIREPPPVTAWV